MRVLLSIKPQFVASIFDGSKTFEFRRKLFMRPNVQTVLIYCTKPVGCIVGEFDIAGILKDEPEALWHRTAAGSGISKAFFDSYFAGRQHAHALQIGAVRIFEAPVEPSTVIPDFTPPQSYRYVADGPLCGGTMQGARAQHTLF